MDELTKEFLAESLEGLDFSFREGEAVAFVEDYIEGMNHHRELVEDSEEQ